MSIFREIFGVIGFKDNASNAIDKVDSKMDSSKSKAIGLQGAMQAIGGAYFLKKTFDVVGSLVELSAQMEDTTTSFEVMLGSAEAAKTMVDDLVKFSDVTPFEDMQIAEAAKMLLNFGIAADDIMPSVQMLGDVSGGNAEKFSRLSLAFGQVSSQGRLMGQDLLQMINAGFNPLQEISKTTGKSVRQLKDEMSKGLVSFDMVKDAFISATGEGGKFHNMMEKQAETWHGLTSTFRGLKNSVLRTFGDIMADVFKPMLKYLIEIMKAFVAWAKTEKGLAILKATLIALVPVIGTLLVGAVWALAGAFIGLMAPLLPIVGIALLIGAALGFLFLVIEDIYTYMQGGESYFGDFVKWFEDFLKPINAAIDRIEAFMDSVRGLKQIKDFFKANPEVMSTAKKSIISAGSAINPLSWPSKIIGGIMDITGKASGGAVASGNPYIVGEAGPELFIPGSTGQIMPNNTFGGITLSKLVGSINITVQNADEGAEVIKTKILDALNELSSSVFPAAAGVVI